jgi:hypothetical protein
MTALAVLAFILPIGPLAVVYGADSHRPGDRGWIGGPHPR